MKVLKVILSVLIVLAIIFATYVGIVSKGFRKWDVLKSQKEKVVDFFNPSTDKSSDSNDLEKNYIVPPEEFNSNKGW